MRALNFARGRAPLGEVLGRLLRDRADTAPHAMAVHSEVLPERLPGFAQANALSLLPLPAVPRIWIGHAVRVEPPSHLRGKHDTITAGLLRIPQLQPGPLAQP